MAATKIIEVRLLRWRQMKSMALLGMVLPVLLAGPSAAARPGAYELLDRVRAAYDNLASYRDRGEIERVVRQGTRETLTRIRFETAAGDGGFRLVLEADTGSAQLQKVLWSDGERAYHFDAGLGQYKETPSLLSEITQSLGEGSHDALMAAAMLAGGGGALLQPEGAALDGKEPCGEATCHRVLLSRMAGTVETTLWIDHSTLLIHRVEVDLSPAQMGPERRSKTLRVRHRIETRERPLVASDFRPELPPGARRVESWQAADAAKTSSEWQGLVFSDEISVDLTSIVARVVDSSGSPILGLTAADFEVQFRGSEVPVVAVDWISTSRPSISELRRPRAQEPDTYSDPGGKSVVFWIQADFNASRFIGHLRLLPQVRPLLDSFHPDDLAAVVSFDSHLKLWQDFTTDRARIEEVVERAIRFGAQPSLTRNRPAPISLADHFDFRAAQKTATPEKALLVTAEALQPLPGEKVLIYLGWGLGRFGAGGVSMTPDYRRAVLALDKAQASVFVLDVTDADYHSLGVGLETVARQTGGTYAQTHLFPGQAAERLARTLEGHYLLTLDRGGLPDAGKIFDVKLKEKRGVVLVRSS